MKTRYVLQADDARRLAEAACRHAADKGWAVTVAVVDEGGHLLHLHRMDGVAPISAQIAPGKAQTAALGRRESKIYEQIVNQGRNAFLSAPLYSMLEGGVPVIVEGEVIGAVGVSGVQSDQDAEIARAGIAALG